MTESEETCTARPRLSIQSVLMPIAVWAALLFIQNWQSMIVVSIVLLTWVFGCNRTRRAVLWVSPAAFLPPLAVIAFVQFSSKATAAATFVSLQKWANFPGMFVERLISDYFPNTVLIAAPMLIAVSVIH